MNTIIDFVRRVSLSRDMSHDFTHCMNVANLTEKIAKSEKISDYLLQKAIVVAWLHDVIDHKYPNGGELLVEMIHILSKLYSSKEQDDILQIIEYVSYSKEKKIGYDNFNLFPSSLLIRNIVSDADKLEALGKIGVERCLTYTTSCNPNISYYLLMKNYLNHCYEKLFILKDKFIRTKEGKRLGEIAHQEFMEETLRVTTINNFDKIAPGLNIEGYLPFEDLVTDNLNTIWCNVIVVLDRPLIDNITIKQLFKDMSTNNYPLLENTIDNLNENNYMATFLACIVHYIKHGKERVEKDNIKIRIHFHQDKHIVHLFKIFDELLVKLNLDMTGIALEYGHDNYIYLQTNRKYDCDILLSFSQCAGLVNEYLPGDILYANTFIPFDGKHIDITKEKKVYNDFFNIKNDLEDMREIINTNYHSGNPNKKHLCTDTDIDFHECRILMVNDLWNPSEQLQYILR
jgi:uncharacterized protein